MRAYLGRRYRHRATAIVVGALLSGFAAASSAQPVPQPPQPAAKAANGPLAATAPGQTEVPAVNALTRGPLHEAYAEPVNTGAVKPLVVPRRPPAAINEVLPDSKPAEEDVLWISGYWGWDDDRKDYDWVSGVWRVPPPGHRWMAGYWTQVRSGFEWVPGVWWPATSEQVAYYPEPPETTEEAPPSQPPSPDDFWVPGTWQWSDSGYAWREGSTIDTWQPFAPDAQSGREPAARTGFAAERSPARSTEAERARAGAASSPAGARRSAKAHDSIRTTANGETALGAASVAAHRARGSRSAEKERGVGDARTGNEGLTGL
jgi:hypothetical protein